MADYSREAIQTLLRRQEPTAASGQGTLGPINMGAAQIPPAVTSPAELAGQKMRDFPAFVAKGEGGYSGGLTLPTGGGSSLGGKVSLGEEQRFELIAKNLGVSSAQLRMWLSLQGGQPSGAGGSYSANPLSLSFESSFPQEGQGSMSGAGSYKLPNVGSVSPEVYGEFSRGASQPNPLESQHRPQLRGATETRGTLGLRGRW
jgi:hypothetical protein